MWGLLGGTHRKRYSIDLCVKYAQLNVDKVMLFIYYLIAKKVGDDKVWNSLAKITSMMNKYGHNYLSTLVWLYPHSILVISAPKNSHLFLTDQECLHFSGLIFRIKHMIVTTFLPYTTVILLVTIFKRKFINRYRCSDTTITSQVGIHWFVHIAYAIIDDLSIFKNHWILNLFHKDHSILIVYKHKLNTVSEYSRCLINVSWGMIKYVYSDEGKLENIDYERGWGRLPA